MKWIEYQILQSAVGEQVVLANKKIGYNNENLAIAQKEAYNGYSIVDDGQSYDKEPIAVEFGGTGACDAKTARKNLDAVGFDDYDGLTVKSGNPVSHNLRAGRGITAISTIEPKQEGSGDPYPAGSGKNLFNTKALTYATSSAAGDDRKLTISQSGNYGTATLAIDVEPNTNYTLSFVVDAFYNGRRVAYAITTVENQNYVYVDAAGKVVKTINTGTATKLYIHLRPTAESGISGTVSFSNIILNKGGEIDYVPYSNIRPLSGWAGAKLTRAGKNLLKNTASNKQENGVSFAVNADGSITVTGNATARTQLMVGSVNLPAGTYIASIGFKPVYGSSGAAFVQYTPDGGSTIFIDMSYDAEKSFTLEKETKVTYLCDIRYAGVDVNNVYLPMIRHASDADSTYEPYQGENFAANFGRTVYGGRLVWQMGALAVKKAMVVLDGTHYVYRDPGWAAGVYNIQGAAPDAVNVAGYTTLADIECSHLPTTTPANVANGSAVVGIGQGSTSFYLNFGLQHKTKEALNAYLAAQKAAGTPVQVTYELAEPIVIQLTPQEIIEALEGLNTVYTDTGKVEVTFNHDMSLLNGFVAQNMSPEKPLSIERGGTGANSAEQARAKLGITPTNIGAIQNDGNPVIQLHDAAEGEYWGFERKIAALSSVIGATGLRFTAGAAFRLCRAPDGTYGGYKIYDEGQTVPITNGGTGANNPESALTNLGAMAKADIIYSEDQPTYKPGAIWLKPVE